MRDRLLSGIRKAADAVGATMGVGGNNGIVEAIASPGHLLTNDGATLLESMKFADPIEELGRKILVEAVSRANKASGDGSSTTTCLTNSILQIGDQFIRERENAVFRKRVTPMDIKRELEACIPLIEQAIKDQKQDISVEDVWKVAAISAEDEEIGRKIGDIYKEIGSDGIIHWDISKTGEDYHTIGRGLTVENAGIASPYMFDQDKQSGNFAQHAKLTNPQVIVSREKLTSAAVFEKLFFALNNQGKKEVVIFCEDFEMTAVAHLVMTYQRQGFRAVLVKLPTIFGDEWAEDIAIASGATVIDPSAGLALKDIREEHIGQMGNITITKSDTFLDGIKDVSEHIERIKQDDSDLATLRAQRLNTKTARYFVGALSDSALSYRRLKVEDAINAAYQALNGGVVIGGGFALANAAETLTNPILKKALLSPRNQIEKNMGKKLTEEDVKEVFDPANVVINAAKNAISVAASILTAHTVVTLPREENPFANLQP